MPTPERTVKSSFSGKRVGWPGTEDALQPGEYAQFPSKAKGPPPEGYEEWPASEQLLYKVQPHHFAGKWFGRTPNGLLVNLSGHKVIEHDDGTISSPERYDIGTEDEERGPGQDWSAEGYAENHFGWHGWLEHGVWLESAPPPIPQPPSEPASEE